MAPRKPPAEHRPGDLADPRPAAILSRIEAYEPDAAWAMYQHLDGRTQQYIAEHVSEKRWSELLLREIEDRVPRDTAPPQRSHRDASAEELCDGLNRHVRNKAIGETPPANWLAYELGDLKFRVSPDRAIAREERPDGAWPLVDTEYVLNNARRSPTPEFRAWVQQVVASQKPPASWHRTASKTASASRPRRHPLSDCGAGCLRRRRERVTRCSPANATAPP